MHEFWGKSFSNSAVISPQTLELNCMNLERIDALEEKQAAQQAMKKKWSK